MQILIGWLLALIGIILDAYSDAYIDKNKKRNHFTEALSIAFYFTSALFFGMFISYINAQTTLIGMFVVFLIIDLLRLGIFNLSYNKFIGSKLSHVGNTSQIDIWLDKLPNLLVIIIYWLSVLSSMIISALLYQLW